MTLGASGLALAAGSGYLIGKAKEPITISNSDESAPPPISGDMLFQFIAVGDVGTGRKGQNAVAEAMYKHWEKSPFSLSLLLGDNIYSGGKIERIGEVFEQPYSALLENGVNFRAAIGNHDLESNEGEDQIAYPGYNMDGRYYTFTEQSVQFFALDTNQVNRDGDDEEKRWNEQLAWLREELAKSSAQWKVVFGHHPVYSSGYHGVHPDLVKELSPILDEYDVQLYINGHDHNYERTQPINGTTYITSGNGAMKRDIGRAAWTELSSKQLGFTAFEVHPDRLVIKAINADNTVYDEAHIGLEN